MTGLRDSLHVDAVKGLDPDVPVVMVNLVKFRAHSLDGDGSGWDAYSRYGAQTTPLLRARGGKVLWAGAAQATAFGAEADGDWDWVVLVWYPTPDAFVEMLTSDEYAITNIHRENGVDRHVIIATHQQYASSPGSS